ncbi:FUSC family protein, partial [Nocardia farcinica]
QAALATARAALADDRSWRRTRPVAQLLTGELDAIERALYPDRTGPPTPLPPRRSLRGTARAESAGPGWILATARVTIAGLVACVASAVAGLGHAAWAVMGSTATLQADTPRHAVVRAVQRAAGTVVGALAIAWPLLAADLSFWQAACVVLVLQVATEIVIAVNYGLAQLLIAPMALLMTALGARRPVRARDRPRAGHRARRVRRCARRAARPPPSRPRTSLTHPASPGRAATRTPRRGERAPDRRSGRSRDGTAGSWPVFPPAGWHGRSAAPISRGIPPPGNCGRRNCRGDEILGGGGFQDSGRGMSSKWSPGSPAGPPGLPLIAVDPPGWATTHCPQTQRR